jgi:hypothetical protein
MWAQALATNSNLIPLPQHDPLTHECLFCSLTFGRVREYFWAVHILAPFSPTPTSYDTTLTLTTLHPEPNDYFLFFLKYYKLDKDFKKKKI